MKSGVTGVFHIENRHTNGWGWWHVARVHGGTHWCCAK
ncbi:hypothetical protein EPIB1_2275 [Tritonibacter mobilis]|nr:hypothetical protein EPIB1_2275 [Tritonibacter mobilis]